MTNYEKQLAESKLEHIMSPERAPIPQGGGYVENLIAKARRMMAPILIASSLVGLVSQASAQQTSANKDAAAAVEPEKASAGSYKISGSASAGIQYFTTGYRKGSNLRLQLNGSKLGPITPSVSATLASAGATGLAPALSIHAGTVLPLASREKGLPPYVAISPSVNTGVQFIFPGLDSEKTSEALVLPFVGGTLSLPMATTIDTENSTYFTFAPSANFVRYIRSNDYSLKVDDKNGDGTPEYMRPKQQLYFGLTTGVNYDKSFINASLYYDPFDPSVEQANGRSVFGYLNVGRNF